MDPLLCASMRQASFKCETPRLELTSSRSFLAIKRFQRTKTKKVINRSRSSKKSGDIYVAIAVNLLMNSSTAMMVTNQIQPIEQRCSSWLMMFYPTSRHHGFIIPPERQHWLWKWEMRTLQQRIFGCGQPKFQVRTRWFTNDGSSQRMVWMTCSTRSGKDDP